MNIKRYYEKTACGLFYAAWISLCIAVILFIILVKEGVGGNVVVIPFGFIIIGICHYAAFAIYDRRGKAILEEAGRSSAPLLEAGDLVLTFMPSPTLRMLLFDPSGEVIGEIRDKNRHSFLWFIPNSLSFLLPRSYCLTDAAGIVRATFRIKGGFTNSLSIKNESNELIGVYTADMRRSLLRFKGMISDSEGHDWIPVNAGSSLYEFNLETVGKRHLATCNKGWMPLEWGKRFKNLNTPVLSFDSQVGRDERIAVLGLCSALFQHYSN